MEFLRALVRFRPLAARHCSCFALAAGVESLPRSEKAAPCMLLHISLVVLFFVVICYVAYRFWRMDKEGRDDDVE